MCVGIKNAKKLFFTEKKVLVIKNKKFKYGLYSFKHLRIT
jgi:hypothetical protein